jgi:hypothetical protein
MDSLEPTLLAYAVDCGTLGEPVIVSDFLGLPESPEEGLVVRNRFVSGQSRDRPSVVEKRRSLLR